MVEKSSETFMCSSTCACASLFVWAVAPLAGPVFLRENSEHKHRTFSPIQDVFSADLNPFWRRTPSNMKGLVWAPHLPRWGQKPDPSGSHQTESHVSSVALKHHTLVLSHLLMIHLVKTGHTLKTTGKHPSVEWEGTTRHYCSVNFAQSGQFRFRGLKSL